MAETIIKSNIQQKQHASVVEEKKESAQVQSNKKQPSSEVTEMIQRLQALKNMPNLGGGERAAIDSALVSLKESNEVSASVLAIYNRIAAGSVVGAAAAKATPIDEKVKELHKAIAQGDVEKVKAIIEESRKNGVDIVNKKGANGNAALYVATENGQEEIVDVLLANGADVNAVNNQGNAALHAATKNGQEKIVGVLLANGADVNAQNSEGKTSLHLAAEENEGSKEVISTLIKNGADTAKVDHEGFTPIFSALNRGKITNAQSILDNVARFRSDEEVKQLLSWRDINGDTAFLRAARVFSGGNASESFSLLKQMVKMGADANAVNAKNSTQTAAGFVFDSGNVQLITQFLEEIPSAKLPEGNKNAGALIKLAEVLSAKKQQEEIEAKRSDEPSPEGIGVGDPRKAELATQQAVKLTHR